MSGIRVNYIIGEGGRLALTTRSSGATAEKGN